MPYFKNDNVNLLIIHIPKTGGSSVEDYFINKYSINKSRFSLFFWIADWYKELNNMTIHHSLQHCTYAEIIKYSKELYVDTNNLKMISIVRNPYDRCISDLFHNGLIQKNSSKEEVYNTIKNIYFKNYYEKTFAYDNHVIPQYLYLTDENEKLADNIIILRTETLNEDMHKIGYTDFNIHVTKNKCNDNKYDNYLNEDSIALINEFYSKDFDFFNYKKK